MAFVEKYGTRKGIQLFEKMPKLRSNNVKEVFAGPPGSDLSLQEPCWGQLSYPKGPRTQIMGFWGRNTIMLMVLGGP